MMHIFSLYEYPLGKFSFQMIIGFFRRRPVRDSRLHLLVSATLSLALCSAASAQSTITQGFESGLGTWTVSNAYWRLDDGRTPSSDTGPNAAAAGSKYLYLETSSGSAYAAGDESILESPELRLSSSELVFRYHMYGIDIGALYVDSFNGGSWQNIWSRVGQQHANYTTGWAQARVPLSISGTVKLRFRGVAAGGYRGDIAIDDVTISNAVSASAPVTYEYDALGRLIKVDDSTNGGRTYRYDDAGNRTQVTTD